MYKYSQYCDVHRSREVFNVSFYLNNSCLQDIMRTKSQKIKNEGKINQENVPREIRGFISCVFFDHTHLINRMLLPF